MGCGCGKTREEKQAEMQARMERRAAQREARRQEVAARVNKTQAKK